MIPALLFLAGSSFSLAAEADAGPKPVRKPRTSWTLQVGLAHSGDDRDHWVVSGFQARFPVYALDRARRSDAKGGIGLEVGLYPYPMISRAYVPGPDADPQTPGKFNFWEAAGVSYESPRFGPLLLEAGARLAFIKPAERVLTAPNGCGLGNRTDARCNEYIKESLKTLDTILFPSFGGDRGVVLFGAAALMWRGIGLRVEATTLDSTVSASGLRFGLTVR